MAIFYHIAMDAPEPPVHRMVRHEVPLHILEYLEICAGVSIARLREDTADAKAHIHSFHASLHTLGPARCSVNEFLLKIGPGPGQSGLFDEIAFPSITVSFMSQEHIHEKACGLRTVQL